MADVKDILGVPRGGAKDQPAPAPAKKDKLKRPEGMSREAFALLAGGLNPIAPTQLAEHVKKVDLKAMKGKRATSRGVVTYQWQAFANPARSDGLQLQHWVKCFRDKHGVVTMADAGDYPFAKYNIKAQVAQFDDEEWDSLIDKAELQWSREETSYLLDLAEQFDLKFVVMADRYDFQGQSRPLEEIKARYYTVARHLLVGREGGAGQVANHPLVKHPYSLQYETDRKRGLQLLMQRSVKQDAEDDVVLEQARQIEQQRRSAASRRPAPGTGVPTGGPAAAAAVAGGALSGGASGGRRAGGPASLLDDASMGAAAPVAAGVAAAAAPTTSAAVPVASMEFTQAGQPAPAGVCTLFDSDVNPFRPPKPGVYARGVHTRDTGQMQLSKVPGGARAQKLVETTIAELGVPEGPRMPTRAVSGAWLSLRNDVVAMLNLKRQLQHRQGNDPGAAGLGVRKKGKVARY